jgi:hypothetical protein
MIDCIDTFFATLEDCIAIFLVWFISVFAAGLAIIICLKILMAWC